MLIMIGNLPTILLIQIFTIIRIYDAVISTIFSEGVTALDLDYIRIMRDLREDADLTQQQVADMLGTSQTMYARYERGANELPIHHLLKLCEIYDVSSDYLLGKTKKR